MHMTFATLKSHGKSHMCHMSLSYLTHILHSHIRHIYISNMSVISDRSDIIYVCHVTLSHDSDMGNSYVLHIVYLPNTDMTDANAYDLCYMEVRWTISYVPYVAKLSDTHITFQYSGHIGFTYGCHLRPMWHYICAKQTRLMPP